jgi:hypothetical protein
MSHTQTSRTIRSSIRSIEYRQNGHLLFHLRDIPNSLWMSTTDDYAVSELDRIGKCARLGCMFEWTYRIFSDKITRGPTIVEHNHPRGPGNDDICTLQ